MEKEHRIPDPYWTEDDCSYRNPQQREEKKQSACVQSTVSGVFRVTHLEGHCKPSTHPPEAAEEAERRQERGQQQED